ncbi:MAG: 3-hydroxyacyl-CoA dehydrogenase NAD-binding domain-containing protein [Methylococcales bacterium]
MTTNYKNWRLQTDAEGISWLFIDKANSTTNVLSSEVITELEQVLTDISNATPKGLIILSAKPNGFIAGADVTEFEQIKDRRQALDYIKHGQGVFDQLEALPFPTISLIDGFCLGGGLELALACRYRIASDESRTRLGLPEVKLGIHPGFGGTMRFNRLIGAISAMDLMLTGRTIDSRRAGKMGIVDYVVPKRHLQSAGVKMVNEQPRPHKPSTFKALASKNILARSILANQFRKQVAKQAKAEHYPAPYSLIDLWQKYATSSQEMLKAEAESVADLVASETSKNLVRIFSLQERMKALATEKDYHPKHVHVIGAGVMGGDIAAWCVVQGFTVTLQDREPKFIAPALKRAKKLFERRFKQRHLVLNALDRLHADHKGLNVEKADVVIEAIVENLAIKQTLYKELEPRLKPEAILATNTSSIELEALSSCLKNPGRLVGIHFFNPVPKMQLVEVIASENTDKKALARATTFVRKIDRLPLPVKSSPGFLVNRILMPYLLEAVTLLSEDHSPETIDQAATNFGMPMGPILLADTVGLDICLSVASILGEKLGLAVPEKLKQMVEQGDLGKKTGKGFYSYAAKGKPEKTRSTPSNESTALITDRLVLRILNESMACLREGVVADTDLLDAGMVFGTGFAPFTGGPMHYVATKGRDTLLERLKELEKTYGERFKPDAGW